MNNMPEPISQNNAASAVVSGLAVLVAVVMVTWRWLLE